MATTIKSTLMAGLAAVGIWLLPQAVDAQDRTGTLLVTVQDTTGGVLPAADVTVTGAEDATRAITVAPLKTTDKGVATFERLPPGRYTIEAAFPGFDKAVDRAVRIRAGETKRTLTLALSHIEDAVTVGVDRQEAAADRALTFGNALTREQIDALSEEPDELRAQLMAMAGDQNATIRVDSFEGQELPPKAMIKSIRISRDQFSAENHFAGGIAIEIITQPGVGPLRGNARIGYYDSALDGKNPLIRQTAPAQNRNVGAGLTGTLAKNRASFSLNVNTSRNATSTPLYYHDTNGLVASNTITTVRTNGSGSGTLDYAVTTDHTIRTGLTISRSRNDDAGIGGFNLAERAYSSTSDGGSFRLQEVGPLGRRFFINTRFSTSWTGSESNSALEAVAINVNDAFNSGGAQQRGHTARRTFSLASDLDYVRGRHSVRAGLLLDGTHYRTDALTNYLGTYTFESLEAFEAGRPRSFTQRIGDPNIRYTNVQTALYLLDDFKLRKSFTLTAGLRYEVQTHAGDLANFGPRVGVTWAPFKSGKTTLRASWGIFHDWLSTGTYEQTLRLDGTHQQQVNVANPSYPDPGGVTALPSDRYLLSPGLTLPRTSRISLAASQVLTTRVQVNASYADARGTGLFVGRNLNAPVDGVRPDPDVVNVIEVISAGQSRDRSLSTGISVNLARARDASNTQWIAWSRNLRLSVNYTIASTRNNTDGPFSLPSTGALDDDWGPSGADARHRGSIYLYTGFLRNFAAAVQFYGTSARPLNITTGRDDNGDLVFNDRPAGEPRNSARTTAQWDSSAYFGYTIPLGSRTVATGGGVSISQVNGVLTANPTAGQAVPRYRLGLTVNIQNLTNRPNYVGYSGVMTSPFFRQPVSATNPRRVTFSANISF